MGGSRVVGQIQFGVEELAVAFEARKCPRLRRGTRVDGGGVLLLGLKEVEMEGANSAVDRARRGYDIVLPRTLGCGQVDG